MKEKIDVAYDFFEEDKVIKTSEEKNHIKNDWNNFAYQNQMAYTKRNNNSIIIGKENDTKVNNYNNGFKKSGRPAFASSEYLQNGTYTSFSGADSIVSVKFRGASPVVLGELSTFTYSIFRPMVPVYSLGKVMPSGFVKGPRTIAGSLIFTIFDRHPLIAALYKAFSGQAAECLDGNIYSDSLPPFDFQVTFLNEYGQSAVINIYDIKITSEGQVMSIEDMITENTMQYIAKDIQVMSPDIHENT